MIWPELFKIRHHRTPWVLVGVYLALVLAAPAWFVFRGPESADIYLDTTLAIFTLAGTLLAPVFGAWLVGHEYRQGTLRRVMAVDARRTRFLGIKAGVGLGVLAVGLAFVGAVGVGAARLAAGINDDTLVTNGLLRAVLAAGFGAAVTAGIALLLSVILRSDTYAMLGALALMVVFGPLTVLIPTIGKYTPYAVTDSISTWIADEPITSGLGAGAAAITLAATLGVSAAVAVMMFQRRDI